MQRTEQTVEVPGGSVVSWRLSAGRDDAVPVLFLHGGPGGSAASFEVFAPWTERRDLVLFDQLGSSTSEWNQPEDELWEIARFCDEVDAVRSAHGLDEVILFGHSWGGWLALEYLCRAADHDPVGIGGVSAAVLADTAASFPSFAASIERRVAEMSPAHQQAIRAAPTSAAARTAGPSYDRAAIEFYRRYVVRGHDDLAAAVFHRQRSTAVFQAMQGADELHADGALSSWDRRPDASAVDCPTLVVVGEFDHMDPRCAEELASALGAAELVVFDGVGHCPHLECPDVLVAQVRAWVDARVR